MSPIGYNVSHSATGGGSKVGLNNEVDSLFTSKRWKEELLGLNGVIFNCRVVPLVWCLILRYIFTVTFGNICKINK